MDDDWTAEDYRKARSVLERLWLTMTTLATHPPNLRNRLPWTWASWGPLHESEFPDPLRPKWRELEQLLKGARVPKAYVHHPDVAKSNFLWHVSNQKRKKVVAILVEVTQTIVYRLADGPSDGG